jgi:histidine triad (HIT) family protein
VKEEPVTDESCLFCRIAAGSIPADVVHEDDLVVAFNDIDPVAPVHQLIIPRQHIASIAEVSEADADLLGRLFAVAAQLADAARLPASGYRVVTNGGADAGQSVAHLHFHLIGGRRMSWPPG